MLRARAYGNGTFEAALITSVYALEAKDAASRINAPRSKGLRAPDFAFFTVSSEEYAKDAADAAPPIFATNLSP